jgi:hypothetical protein
MSVMAETATLVNRVEKSGLIVIDLDDFRNIEPIEVFDLKIYLVNELVLMEKPFREALQNIDWNNFSGKPVAVTCSADALIPMWAFMLVATNLQPHAKKILFGDSNKVQEQLLLHNIQAMDVGKYSGERVILKGCGKNPIPAEAYFLASKLLMPVVKSLMYGEPCSTVPVYKKTTNDE